MENIRNGKHDKITRMPIGIRRVGLEFFGLATPDHAIQNQIMQ